jgi:ribosomal protein S1
MENQQTEFAKLFEESLATKELKEGEIVTGHIVKISKDFVMVDERV